MDARNIPGKGAAGIDHKKKMVRPGGQKFLEPAQGHGPHIVTAHVEHTMGAGVLQHPPDGRGKGRDIGAGQSTRRADNFQAQPGQLVSD